MAPCAFCHHTGVHGETKEYGRHTYCEGCAVCDIEYAHAVRAAELECNQCHGTDVTTINVGGRVDPTKYMCADCGTRPISAFSRKRAA
jgi:hypothetical protein